MSSERPEPASPQPLRSKHTSNFPACSTAGGVDPCHDLPGGQASVLGSRGQSINTHFRDLNRPMGLAADSTGWQSGRHKRFGNIANCPRYAGVWNRRADMDACYLPRTAHVTGTSTS